MGQKAFDIEDCMQGKTKRTLSLVLALIMICSTLGVMAFAQERGVVVCHECPQRTCGSTQCVEKTAGNPLTAS